jgi:hypothetical protein
MIRTKIQRDIITLLIPIHPAIKTVDTVESASQLSIGILSNRDITICQTIYVFVSAVGPSSRRYDPATASIAPSAPASAAALI